MLDSTPPAPPIFPPPCPNQSSRPPAPSLPPAISAFPATNKAAPAFSKTGHPASVRGLAPRRIFSRDLRILQLITAEQIVQRGRLQRKIRQRQRGRREPALVVKIRLQSCHPASIARRSVPPRRPCRSPPCRAARPAIATPAPAVHTVPRAEPRPAWPMAAPRFSSEPEGN